MNCWIVLFHVCAFSPDEVYMHVDMTQQIGDRFTYTRDGVQIPDGWLAHAEIGWEIEATPRLTIQVKYFHESHPGLSDRGQERMGIGFTYRPWR